MSRQRSNAEETGRGTAVYRSLGTLQEENEDKVVRERERRVHVWFGACVACESVCECVRVCVCAGVCAYMRACMLAWMIWPLYHTHQ